MENELTALSALCTNAAKEVSDFHKLKKEYNFVDDKSLNIDQRIENAEGHFDRLDEVFERKKNITTSLNTIVTDLDSASNKIKSELASYSTESDNDKLYEIFNIRIELYEEKCNIDTKPLKDTDQIYKIVQIKNSNVDQIIKSQKFINSKKREHITLEEKNGLEKLTGYKLGSVVFDPDKDDWSTDTPVFIDKVMNKCNLCFLVEDTNHNKFGGVFTGYINKVGDWLNGGNSYIFSLVRNGTLNPKKFGKTGIETDYEFFLYPQYSQYLFLFGVNGNDICVRKKNENGSYCNSHVYTAKENELTDNKYFTPKSVVVFQLN